MTQLLKPCPFCGKEVNLTEQGTLSLLSIVWRYDPLLGYRTYHKWKDRKFGDTECCTINCDMTRGGCGVEITGDTKNEVIELWNTRNSTSETKLNNTFEKELKALRLRVKRQRAELRRFNRDTMCYWAGFNRHGEIRSELDYRSKMIKAFGFEAVRKAEKGNV